MRGALAVAGRADARTLAEAGTAATVGTVAAGTALAERQATVGIAPGQQLAVGTAASVATGTASAERQAAVGTGTTVVGTTALLARR